MFMAVPLLAVPVIVYNLFVLLGADGRGDTAATTALAEPVFSVAMASGAWWSVGMGEILLFFALIILFFELLKSTSSQRVAIVNHALSMILFVVCLIEFLLLRGFATSVFFLIMTMVLLDVLAGFIVTIVSARRDFDIANTR